MRPLPPLPSCTRTILAQLDKAGAVYTLHHHVEVRTIEQARLVVPALTINLLKTVVFTVKNTARLLLVAVPCDASVDYKQVAIAAGCSRRALRLVEAERIEQISGFEVGGVGPFRVTAAMEVIIDPAYTAEASVKVGAGRRSLTLELTFHDLTRLSDATLAPVARSPS